MRITTTGHRPKYWESIKGEKSGFFHQLDWYINFKGHDHSELVFLHGCALGVDTWFGEYAMKNNIALELHPPFPVDVQIEKAKMDKKDIVEFRKQLEYATDIFVTNQNFSMYGYQKRNMALVDNSDVVLGWYRVAKSGSGNCINYAKFRGVPNYNLRTMVFRRAQ
ncbi:MAG: hypothetical protein FVQ80_06620 [Planctomycetes bacterium]|nr:hypothetical protein [Planctomycetota bacterium]